MGALISFELARALRQEYGIEPRHLFISAHRAPQLPAHHSPIHQLSDADLIEKLRKLNGTPEAILQHKELMQLALPTLRADFALCEHYDSIYQKPLSCPISACGGTQDKHVTYDELKAWKNQTTNAFTLRMLPGDHFFLHTTQKLLLQAIAEDLTWHLD